MLRSKILKPTDPESNSAELPPLRSLPGSNDTLLPPVADCTPALHLQRVPQLLAVARPTIYRHDSPLCQLPWRCNLQGLWIVVAFFAGSGGLLVALAALGIRFIALCAEEDDQAAELIKMGFPDAIQIVKAEELDARMLIPVLEKRKCRGVLVAGGCPRQANTALNRIGSSPSDVHGDVHQLIIDAASSVRHLEQTKSLEVLELFENPVGRPEFQAKHARDFGGEGVMINAAVFGWVWRRRLFYGRGAKGTFASLSPEGASCYLPEQAVLVQTPGAVPSLQWRGKPVPERIRWRGGFTTAIDAGDVVAKKGQGAMFTFTDCSKRPDDQPASQCAKSRWAADGKRFPAPAYEATSMLTRSVGGETTFRTPLAVERAEVHGFPSSLIETGCDWDMSAEEKEDRRCSLVGNGFHIPSLMLALVLLASLQGTDAQHAPLRAPLPELWETRLRNKVRGTAFEPGACGCFPGVYDAMQVAHELWELFKPLGISHAAFDKWTGTFASETTSKDLATLQVYWVHARMRGHSGYEQGPEWASQKRRAEFKAVLSEQRGSSISKKGMFALVAPGHGKDVHMANARRLSSPFDLEVAIDDDLWFAAICVATYGPHIRIFRNAQSKAFQRVCRNLQGLDLILKKVMHADVARVAATKSPAVMGLMTILMRWPDRTQPVLFVKGFPMVGHMTTSQVFRSRPSPTGDINHDPMKDFLGPRAAAWVDDLEDSPPRWADVQAIYDQTIKEQKAGYCGPLRSRGQLDDMYGIGGWRPQKRFLITQAGGKRRVIDDACKSGHNAATSTWETIFTVSCEFPVLAARTLLREVLKMEVPGCDLSKPVQELTPLIPEWLDIVQFLQDMVDAYRQVPSDPAHAPVMQIAVYVPGAGWRYTQMYGNPFGMTSAVLNFNRLPTLNVAFCRRAMGVLAAAYFDDNVGVDTTVAEKSGEAAMICVFSKVGSKLSPTKAMPPAPRRVFLGADVDLGEASRMGMCTIDLKEHARADMIEFMDTIVASRSFSSGNASKLRGLLGWSYTGVHGKCARGGQAALMDRQYNDQYSTSIDRKHLAAFEYNKLILRALPPKRLQLIGAVGPPIIVYSDAFFKPYDEPAPADGVRCRMGWVIFDPRRASPVGGTMYVPERLLAQWSPRNQQVFVAEALAVMAATLLHQDILQGRDVIWFVDNIGALQVLIKGNSSQFDAGNVCAAAHLFWAAAGTRVWFEWVASDDNPSDGLSRNGLLDEWTRRQEPFWEIAEYEAPAWFALIDLPIQQLRDLFPT
jgi:hypothetical protein